MTVLIDVDDVLNNLCEVWCRNLNSRYGTQVEVKDITNWEISKFFPALTKEQIFEPLNHEEFWKSVEPRHDAVEYVSKLYNEGFDIYICTATDYKSIKFKYEHLILKYFPYIRWNHVIVAYQKQMIYADVLIDDCVQNLEGGNYIKILMTMPYNKDFDAKANEMVRVYNWKDVYRIISRLRKEGSFKKVEG